MNTKDFTKELERCVQYQEYMETLAKMKNDTTLPYTHQVTASLLFQRLGVHHMKQCVAEVRNRRWWK